MSLNLVKVISTAIVKAQRIVKVLRYGTNDIQTASAVAPYGVDSNPISGMIAVYAPTVDIAKKVIIGYINKNALADVGEYRTFATDADGNVQFYTWLKKDGTYEIGGAADNAVRYSKLNDGLQSAAGDINTELGKIAAAISSLGGTYTLTPLNLDISASKINEVKTL